MNRIVAAGVAAACCVSLLLYWPGLWAWFQQDDFAWLALGRDVRDAPSLLTTLFAPMAQGTIRPLSERAYFMGLYALFGLESFPFRLCVFLTQFGALALLGAVAYRVTGSKAAGFAAPLLWAAHSSLGRPMAWSSAYNQVLCCFFLLLAFLLFVRWQDSGSRRTLAAQWAAFFAGLGSHEAMVVYPAVVLTWCLLDRHSRSDSPRPDARVPHGRCMVQAGAMLLASGAYTALHLGLSRGMAGPVYAAALDSGVLRNAGHYWLTALGPARIAQFRGVGPLPFWGVTALLTLGFAAAVVVPAFRNRDLRAWLGPAVFALTILPVLPLTQHRMDYYLVMPAAGLALWGAAGLATARRAGRRWFAATIAVACIYGAGNAYAARRTVRWAADRSEVARTIVLGARTARQAHPSGALILEGLDDEAYRITVYHEPFRLLGLSDIYVGPEAAGQVRILPGDKPLARFVLPAGASLAALSAGEAEVYVFGHSSLRNATREYAARGRLLWNPLEPSRVDVGQPWFARQLDKGWYNVFRGNRWMAQYATVRLGVPRTSQPKLAVKGFCPAAQVRSGPLRVRFSVNGIAAGDLVLREPDAVFEAELPLKNHLNGKQVANVSVEVERTFVAPPDVRPLGLIFGTFEIRD